MRIGSISFPRALGWALAAGLAMRVWIVSIDPYERCFGPGPTEVQTLARGLLEHGVLSYDGKTPSAFRLPFQPLLLAVLYSFTGDPYGKVPIYILNTLLSAAVVILTFLCARRFLPEKTAVLAAWLSAVNPSLAQLDITAGVEPTFIFQLALLAYALAWLSEETDKTRRWVWAGAAVGFSLLSRSTFMLFPFFLAAGLWLWDGRSRRPGAAVLMALSAYLFLAPWIIRNWVVFKRIIPFEDGMGMHMLYHGTVDVEGIQPDDNLPEPLRTYFFTKDPRIGPLSKEIAIRNIKEDPLRYGRFCFGRLSRLWLRGGWAERLFDLNDSFMDYLAAGRFVPAAVKFGVKVLEFAFVSLSVVGLFYAQAFPQGRVLALMILYMNIHIFTMGLSRYTWPVIPQMAILAALAWGRLRERVSS